MSAKPREALFFEREPGRAVTCLLCPHACRIAPGGFGRCRVRKNEGGSLMAQSYGRISSLALDPIEKKPLLAFCPGAMILSAGSCGCNFRCPYCQNHAISMGTPHTAFLPPEELAAKAAELKNEGNIGVAFTYNEPLIGYEYVMDSARVVKALGMKNVLVTNGYVNEAPLERLAPYIDAVNLDIKGGAEFYEKLCGGDCAHVWRSAEIFARSCHLEVTTLIIPGENDSPEIIDAISARLASINPDTVLHLTRFYPRYNMTDKPPTGADVLRTLAKTARARLPRVFSR